ncbi:MAG: hypothetical protein ABII22_04135 [Candidatus Micrarchaeota archaeon]
MRDTYYLNEEYMKGVDMRILLKVMLEYLAKKATQLQTEFQITSRRREITKEEVKKLVSIYIDSKIPDLALYDEKGALFESYGYGKKFMVHLTKEEFVEFQKVLEKNRLPEKIFFNENDAEVLRKRAFGLITTEKINKK